jgi:hypothetical protein
VDTEGWEGEGEGEERPRATRNPPDRNFVHQRTNKKKTKEKRKEKR